MNTNIQYINWSDKGLDLYENGQLKPTYALFDHFFECDTNELWLVLRRNTSAMKDFIILLDEQAARSLYETLREQFEPTNSMHESTNGGATD